MLLREGSEDEVGMGFGQEALAGLGSGTAAPDASRPAGDFGRSDVVTGTTGVGIGRYETGESLFLVRLQDVNAITEKHQADSDTRQQTQGYGLLPTQAPKKNASNGNWKVRQGCSQVGLSQNHQHWK